MKKEIRTLIGLIIIFVAFLVMAISIYNTSHDLDCNQCVIEFTSKSSLGEETGEFKMKMIDLYTPLAEEGFCKVEWDRSQGYIRK